MRTIMIRVGRMKIAFVYDAIYPYVKGGVERRVWELAVRLSLRGHSVHLFGMKFWEGEDVLFRDGVYLHGVCPAQKLYSGGRRSIMQPLWFSVYLISPLLREKFDIIDCQQFPFFPVFPQGLSLFSKKLRCSSLGMKSGGSTGLSIWDIWV